MKVVARIEDPGVYPSGSSTTWTVPRATAARLKAHERTALRCGFDPVPTAAPSAAAWGYPRAQTAVGCKYAMEAREVHPRFRNGGCQARDEIQRADGINQGNSEKGKGREPSGASWQPGRVRFTSCGRGREWPLFFWSGFPGFPKRSSNAPAFTKIFRSLS